MEEDDSVFKKVVNIFEESLGFTTPTARRQLIARLSDNLEIANIKVMFLREALKIAESKRDALERFLKKIKQE